MRVLVVGQGVIGRAVCWALAGRNVEVLGYDAREAHHREGSSHGESRIIRTAYFEHPDYVPLAQKSFELWRALEGETEKSGILLEDAPCLTIGKPDSSVVAGVIRAASEHGLEVEELNSNNLANRFPWLRCETGWTGVLEKAAGVLDADACRLALAESAVNKGAQISFGQAVLSWGVGGEKVWIKTAFGQVEGDYLVLCPGPWAREVFGPQGDTLKIMRQVVGWTRFDTPLHRGFPVFFFDTPEGYYYGMRGADRRGVKIARHYGAPELDSVLEARDEPDSQDAIVLDEFVRKYTPGMVDPVGGPAVERMEVCRYTLTPDRHFLVGELPGFGGKVQVAGGMSGHGFKFAPAIGALMADTLLDGHQPPALFSPFRFS